MHPIIRVVPEAEFMAAELNREYPYAISIQDTGRYPNVLAPGYSGKRLDLYFDDAVAGPTIATREDIEKLYAFSLSWRNHARQDPASAAMIIHCLAGVSRSAAVAMMPLALHYGSYREAARRLFLARRYYHPNTHILHLIEEKLSPGQPSLIFEAVLEFQG